MKSVNILFLCGMLALYHEQIACSDEFEDDYGQSESDDYPNKKIKSPFTKTMELNYVGRLRKRFAMTAIKFSKGRDSVCSPALALLPLGKLVLGAVGKASKQLQRAIGLKHRSEVKTTFQKLITEFYSVRGVSLTVANRIYVSEKIRLKENFVKECHHIFGSVFEKIDFKNDAEAAKRINTWVNYETKGKISRILESSDIASDTVMIMVNAIYYKGFWQTPFHDVRKDTFHAVHGDIDVKMMRQDGTFPYYESSELNAQLIDLPYKGGDASFLVILPNDNIASLLNKLEKRPKLIRKALHRMSIESVKLTMPSFKIETTLNLKDVYQTMDVDIIFRKKESGLDDMTEIRDEIHVGKAKQKAIIEVNALGTEAAAADSLSLVPVSAIITNVKFKANRPFYFILRAKREQLFSGVYSGKK